MAHKKKIFNYNGDYFKLISTDEKFNVSEIRGTVKCRQMWKIKLTDTERDLVRALFPDNWKKMVEFATVGISSLTGEDAWNEALGKHIAQSKSHVKAYAKYERFAKRFKDALASVRQTAANTMSFATELRFLETTHVEDISK